MTLRPAVFLDRDGVLVVPEFRDGRSFAPRTLGDFFIYPGAKEALSRLREAGFLLVVVTNQPDIGNGKISPDVIAQMHDVLNETLAVDRIELCPHGQNAGCDCRKPKPGMILKAAQACGIDLAKSYMVGDRRSDVDAGVAAGCKTVFIDLHYAAEKKPKHPDIVAQSITDAVDMILGSNMKVGKANDAR